MVIDMFNIDIELKNRIVVLCVVVFLLPYKKVSNTNQKFSHD